MNSNFLDQDALNRIVSTVASTKLNLRSRSPSLSDLVVTPPSLSSLSRSPSRDKDNGIRKRISKPTATERKQITEEVRGRLRSSTNTKTKQAEARWEEIAGRRTGQHVRASGRAIPDEQALDTHSTNQAQILQLHTNKSYKDGTLRIHFKGDRLTDDSTIGTPLSGKHIKRSGWGANQKVVNYHLSETLKRQPNFIGAPNSKGMHGAEVAHLRAQHAGGLTDELGAQSASWHSNVEDMAREEGQAKLADKFTNVRLKSTAYIHESGSLMGTVKASRHKIYFQDGTDGSWHKKFDHLQDGARGNINLSEVKALKKRVKNLSLSSTDANLHPGATMGGMHHANYKGIDPGSLTLSQTSFMPHSNNTMLSPYFTDIRASNGNWVKDKTQAGIHMSGLISSAAQEIKTNKNMFFKTPAPKKGGRKK